MCANPECREVWRPDSAGPALQGDDEVAKWPKTVAKGRDPQLPFERTILLGGVA